MPICNAASLNYSCRDVGRLSTVQCGWCVDWSTPQTREMTRDFAIFPSAILYYGDFTWVSWRLRSPATQLFVQQLGQAKRIYINAPYSCILGEENHQRPHKRPIMLKVSARCYHGLKSPCSKIFHTTIRSGRNFEEIMPNLVVSVVPFDTLALLGVRALADTMMI